ncbi:hypothetical protein HanXRQr2_Chr07g0308391 [Helianthus annuus]|uniref:Uncharacterized protein n=1 Tax=Helianthus annuus TaxID=4232 RepID=A0A9K3NHB2_HELAN|nr:hypothetical protein HanXRQr2_Chr07g0308391 [Helianthus annuus]
MSCEGLTMVVRFAPPTFMAWNCGDHQFTNLLFNFLVLKVGCDMEVWNGGGLK